MKPIVFIEGGGGPEDVVSLPEPLPGYIDLTQGEPSGTRQLLTDAFYRLFEKAVPDLRVFFDISLNGGYEETVGNYVKARQIEEGSAFYLMIDFQDIGGKDYTHKYVTIQNLADNYIKTKQLAAVSIPPDVIFFMVQKMDAWILSQPSVIDEAYPHAKGNPKHIKDKTDRHIALKHDTIYNPDWELKVLLGYYEEEKRGKKKKLKYGKIKTATQLLPLLNIDKLQQDFEDVRQFVEMLRSL